MGWGGKGGAVRKLVLQRARKLVGMLTLDTFASETIVASDAAQ